MKILFLNSISILGNLIIGIYFPLLWFQGMRIKRTAPRIPTPEDCKYGICKAKIKVLNMMGIGESTRSGVGITKHAITLTGLTAVKLNKLVGYIINWSIIEESGLSLKNLNNLIKDQSYENTDIMLVTMGANDIFQLKPPWLWKKTLIY